MNVRDIIEADPELAKALAQLLTQRTQVRVAGNRSVGVGGSVNGANIVTGDGNIVGGPSRTPDVDGPPKA
jgi:hypothetical protein